MSMYKEQFSIRAVATFLQIAIESGYFSFPQSACQGWGPDVRPMFPSSWFPILKNGCRHQVNRANEQTKQMEASKVPKFTKALHIEEKEWVNPREWKRPCV